MNEKNILVVGIFVVDLSFNADKLPTPGETIIGVNCKKEKAIKPIPKTLEINLNFI